VQRWVLMRHRGWDGHLDGYPSWVLVKRILQELGWSVSHKPADLRKKFAAWERTLPPPNPVDVPTKRLGKLLLVVPPAERAPAKSRPPRGRGIKSPRS
jgi:hypothetical protein